MKQALLAGGLAALCIFNGTMAKDKTVTLKIVETSDVHGAFFPYDFINRKPMAGSMARVSSYLKRERATHGQNLILLENGDILQGQPVSYYSNYLDTLSHNIGAEVVNYLRYDAQCIGNHDVETGHKVYDKWIAELNCPTLGANVIDLATGKPYLKPYTIIERDGVKIGILGLITPAIPYWLPQGLWSGLRFDDMLATARQWTKTLREKEKVDFLIGLFHSGREGGITTPHYTEDAALQIAREVPGFNLVLFGHDHTRYAQTVTNTAGEEVVCLDPANNAMYVAEATFTLGRKNGRWQTLRKEAALADMRKEEPDPEFMRHFDTRIQKTTDYVSEEIGEFKQTICTRDSYFGNSAFNDLILNLQLQITGADISFNAPLTFDESIKAGKVHVSDMFNLYKFENQLYVLRMTGEEIRKYLEMSYDQWVNTMQSPDDHLLLLDVRAHGDAQRMGFKNLFFNFDSAAGIDYEVDVTKPNGSKVTIFRMSNGKPFDEKATYRVATNSYRANGGGELLTKGAGIPQDSLPARVIYRSDKDQRHYLMQEIRKAGIMDPKPNHNWRFVPETWVKAAAARDRELLFGKQ